MRPVETNFGVFLILGGDVMRSLSSGVLCLAVLLGGSCKPLHDREGLDPVSEPEYVASKGGTILTAIRAKQAGICIIRSLLNDPQSAQLVTVRGALSYDQLKSSLRFMGYGEHIAVAIGTVVLGGLVGGRVGSRTVRKVGLDALDHQHTPAVTADMVKAVVIGATTAVGGAIGYRVVKGNIEGERAEPIAVHSLLSVFPGAIFSPVVEYFHRGGRLKKVLSDKEEWRITDKKMRKLLKKLGDIYPAYPGQCDHIEV